MARTETLTAQAGVREIVAGLVARARAAQAIFERSTQEALDLAAVAVGWAIMNPSRNRALAELAVRDTGLGVVADKIAKNHRKTLGLLRDLRGARSTGIIAEYPEKGLTEYARPVGVVAAVVPSTNPGATPANNIINAVKCGNAVIVAPSPKGYSTAALLLEHVHAEFGRIGAPLDLVQLLPAPVTRELTNELMTQADLVVVTGSQSNVRAGYSSGTPCLGVGLGNVAVIVDESADLAAAAAKIMLSKTFDNATSCSSENALIIHEPVYERMLASLAREGAALLAPVEKETLRGAMFPGGKLSPAITAQPVGRICTIAGLARPALVAARCLMVEETGAGPDHPFSGEKLSPVLALYRARDFDHACDIMRAIYAYQGNGHSCGIHTRNEEQPGRLGREMTVCRVIVNQAHAIATGGSFDNGLPFSLSMGCGTWGRNSISDNLNYRHFMNVTRVVRPIPEVTPTEEELFGAYWRQYRQGAMNFEEHVGKALLAARGIGIPRGEVARTAPEAAAIAGRLGAVVVKAQVPAGKRGKAGGIRLAATPEEAGRHAAAIIGMEIGGYRVEKVLVEEKTAILRELYAGVVNDCASKGPLVVFSTEGGMDIEEVAASAPGRIRSRAVDIRRGFSRADALSLVQGHGLGAAESPAADALALLYEAYLALDAELLEVNPLAVTRDGRVTALDCKLVMDDCAIVRHREIAQSGTPDRLTGLEARARDAHLKYIELDGNVGVLANGAGLTMTTMDMVRHHGGRPANFLEIGGESYTQAKPALALLLSKRGIRSLVINFCGAFARTDVMTQGVIEAMDELKPDLPVFFSVHGTGDEEAIRLLKERLGVTPLATMDEACKAAVEAAA